MPSPIVTLTTDWGEGSFFAGMVKGRLHSTIQDVRVVDVTHGLHPFDLVAASFVIRNACLGFPPGTVHIIDVLSEEQPGQVFVAVSYHSQYFLCTNNGLPYTLFGRDYEKSVQIAAARPPDIGNFAAFNIFCPAAAKLAAGARLDDLGDDMPLLERRLQLYMVIGDTIKTHAWHIDSYGNVYLDIRYDEMMRELGDRRFELNYRGVRINDIQPSYKTCEHPSLVVSATGYMEIAMYKQRVADMLGMPLYTIVDITKK